MTSILRASNRSLLVVALALVGCGEAADPGATPAPEAANAPAAPSAETAPAVASTPSRLSGNSAHGHSRPRAARSHRGSRQS